MKLFAACYGKLLHHRVLLVLILLLLMCGAGWFSLSQLEVKESIKAMLPDGKSQVARDFQLMQRAPFANEVVIHLTAEKGNSADRLIGATKRLSTALPAKLFHNVLCCPGQMSSNNLFQQLGDYLPRLMNTQDLQTIAERLSRKQIDKRLGQALMQLLQPQGMALKQKIRRDPLQLEKLALQKLQFLNPIPDVRIERGCFISRNGRSSLILADTPVPITDAGGSKVLLDAFAKARQQLPAGIKAELISGHRYTLANAKVIQEDMQRVLLVSGIGIFLLFLLFLRSLRALSVYLLPLFSMLGAMLVSGLWFEKLSGITIGFGAVLLGITIDFGLHVYFALRYGNGTREQLLQTVSRPVLMGGLTTFTAFAVLLLSELPGQRQLAVFAMAGIVAALLLALLILPHFIGDGQKPPRLPWCQSKLHITHRFPGLRITVLILWLSIIGFAAWQIQNLTINDTLRQLSYLPPKLQQAEQRLKQDWGNLRGRALVFASATNLEHSLRLNEQVWEQLKKLDVEDEAVSLAPLFPSRRTQKKRLQNWKSFWQQRKAATLDLLESSGQKYGFSSSAFEPFRTRLNHSPNVIDQRLIKNWGLGRMLDTLLLTGEHGYQLLTLIPDRPDLIRPLDANLAKRPDVDLVSQSRFGRQLSSVISSDFSRFFSYAGITILTLLFLLFRRLTDVLLVLLPVFTGLLIMFGSMGWLGLDMNMFNAVASVLIIGIGVDYGIFMVCHSQQEKDLATPQAILISGLTTVVGFGALVLAKHPALHSIGLTVLLGISAAVPTAVLVIPSFRLKRR